MMDSLHIFLYNAFQAMIHPEAECRPSAEELTQHPDLCSQIKSKRYHVSLVLSYHPLSRAGRTQTRIKQREIQKLDIEKVSVH